LFDLGDEIFLRVEFAEAEASVNIALEYQSAAKVAITVHNANMT
jgi:hypothetical protein